MLGDDIRFAKQFRELIEDVVQQHDAGTASGACKDWAEYRFNVGFGVGLRRAYEMAQTIEDRLSGRDQQGTERGNSAETH